MKDKIKENEIVNKEKWYCPICGDEHNHVHRVKETTGQYDNRTAAEIKLYCERGHAYKVEFENYKGELTMKITFIKEIKEFPQGDF